MIETLFIIDTSINYHTIDLAFYFLSSDFVYLFSVESIISLHYLLKLAIADVTSSYDI